MKYFVFTYQGDSLPLAYKLQQEGHDVVAGIVQDKRDIHAKAEGTIQPEDTLSHTRRLSLYDNMLTKVPAWDLVEKLKHITPDDQTFVFFDRNSLFRFSEAVMSLGFHGNFPTEQDYLFEQDRDAAKDFVKKYYPKVHVAEIREFNKVSEAKDFLLGTDAIWVLKGKTEAAGTFLPDVDDPKLAANQILQALDASKEQYEQAGFILELLIDNVMEFTPEKLYYDGEPIAITMDIENKPFGSGNTSIQTGCAQDMVFPLSFDDRINEIAFPPIVDEIAKKHKGLFFWDASLLIDKRTGKIYFGEFCSNRAGYNSLFSEIAQCSSASDYFEQIIKKRSPFTMGTVACSVTLFNPNTDEENNCHPPKDEPIDFKGDIGKDIWLWDVYQKGKRLVTAGDDQNLAVITASGKSIDEAVNRLYRNVDDFSFVGAYYRPRYDYVSLEYSTSIPSRFNYGLDRGLYKMPFMVKIGEIKLTNR